MKDSDEPTLPGGPGFEDIKRYISGALPENMGILEAISKMQITLKDKARADEKAEHTREYVSILRRSATQ